MKGALQFSEIGTKNTSISRITSSLTFVKKSFLDTIVSKMRFLVNNNTAGPKF